MFIGPLQSPCPQRMPFSFLCSAVVAAQWKRASSSNEFPWFLAHGKIICELRGLHHPLPSPVWAYQNWRAPTSCLRSRAPKHTCVWNRSVSMSYFWPQIQKPKPKLVSESSPRPQTTVTE
jgi:hypothetical protein